MKMQEIRGDSAPNRPLIPFEIYRLLLVKEQTPAFLKDHAGKGGYLRIQ